MARTAAAEGQDQARVAGQVEGEDADGALGREAGAAQGLGVEVAVEAGPLRVGDGQVRRAGAAADAVIGSRPFGGVPRAEGGRVSVRSNWRSIGAGNGIECLPVTAEEIERFGLHCHRRICAATSQLGVVGSVTARIVVSGFSSPEKSPLLSGWHRRLDLPVPELSFPQHDDITVPTAAPVSS